MANELMKALAKHEGYCCLFALFVANQHTKTGAFAKRYGVTRQAIRYWRLKFRYNQLACVELPDCLNIIGVLGRSQDRVSAPSRLLPEEP